MPTVRSGYPTRPRMPTAEILLRRAAKAAEVAQETADEAIEDAAEAQTTADTAVADAAQAQADADAAQGTADTAVAAAGAAQTDATQALADAAAVDVRVDNTLSGTEQFTALNVGGTNVKPFLDKTDGEKLTNAAGIADGLVDTSILATTAIRPGAPATNSAEVLINGLNAVGGNVNAAASTEVVSATFTLPEELSVTIKMLATFEASNAETCEMALLIDDPGTKSMNEIRAMETTDANRFRLLEVNDPGGDASAVAQIITTQTLAAGSHTVRLVALARLNEDEFSVPRGSAAIEVFVR